jgi:hypothetical protein
MLHCGTVMPIKEDMQQTEPSRDINGTSKSAVSATPPSSYFPQGFHDTNAVFTFVGFFITLWVLWSVRNIRANFTARAMLPDVIKELHNSSSAVSSTLSNWPMQRNEAVGHFKTATSLLKSGMSYAEKADRKKLRAVYKKMEAASSSVPIKLTFDEAWDLYTDVLNCTMILTQYNNNLKWS